MRTTRHRRLLRHLGYAASAGILAWLLFGVLPDLGDLDEAGQLLLAHLRPTDVALAAGLLAAYLFTHAATITTATPGVSLGAAVRARAMGGAVARFVPAGWAAGTGVLVTVLRSSGIRAGTITHTLAVTTVWNTLTKLLLPLLGLAAVALLGRAAPVRGGQLAALMIAGLLAVGAALRVLSRPEVARRIARIVERPVSAIAVRTAWSAPPALPERAVELQASIAEALRKRPLEMGLWYSAHHLTHVALVYLGMRIAARSGGLEVGVPEVLAAFAVGYLLTGLPFTPVGWGPWTWRWWQR